MSTKHTSYIALAEISKDEFKIVLYLLPAADVLMHFTMTRRPSMQGGSQTSQQKPSYDMVNTALVLLSRNSYRLTRNMALAKYTSDSKEMVVASILQIVSHFG